MGALDKPSDKSLGYFQPSLRDEESILTMHRRTTWEGKHTAFPLGALACPRCIP